MRLANKIPKTALAEEAANDDPREAMSADVIDLASRNGFPTVTQRKGKSDGLGLLAGIAVVGLIGAVTLWGMNSARVEPAPLPVPAAAPSVAAQASAPVIEQPVIAPAPDTAGRADPAPSPIFAQRPAIDTGAATNPYNSPTVVFDSSARPVAIGAPGGAGLAAAPASGEEYVGDSSGSEFASRIGGVGGGTSRATRTIDPTTTVTQGTLIPAVLETAIDTDTPGFVRAVVSRDVRSYDGTKVLVPRSSRLIGQYQSGLQAGQKRAYVVWTRLLRPDGVSVTLASPGTDFAGTAGLPGKVDNHFFQKFGSGILLSVVGGLAAIGSGGASVILGGGQSAAAAAVTDGGKIGPTIRVRQGEPIRVFTARDLDFSEVG